MQPFRNPEVGMQLLNGLSTLAFVLVGATVGIRLLLLASRTREVPEMAVGLALLLIGGIGYPLVIAAGAPRLVPPATGVRLMAAGSALLNLGFVFIVVFTWKVFRTDETWARIFSAAMIVGYAVQTVGGGLGTLALPSPMDALTLNRSWSTLGQMLNTLAFGWTAFEAYRYWGMLRRRLRLGIGDAVTTNRFFLWACAGTSSILTSVVTWWVLFRRLQFFQEPGIQATIALLAVASCVSQYLAFLPPKAYVQRLRASHPQA